MIFLEDIFSNKSKVLIADDNDETATLLSLFLSSRSFRVQRARNGQEAVEMARKSRPDLVLLDITMPKLDGMGALALLKSDPKTRGIPVLMCTDHSLLEDVEKCCSNGAAGYILKPFDLGKVMEKVESVLAKKK